MDVQIQRPAEPLNDGDGTTAPVRDSVALCALAQKPEDGAHVHSDYRATQIVIPRQHVAQPIGQGQHPLADRQLDGEFGLRQTFVSPSYWYGVSVSGFPWRVASRLFGEGCDE